MESAARQSVPEPDRGPEVGSPQPVPPLREVPRRLPEATDLLAPVRLPAPLGVSLVLWVCLGLSAGFFIAAQMYVAAINGPGRQHQTLELNELSATGEFEAAELQPLSLYGPEGAIHAGNLWLRWDEIDGARSYRLRIFGPDGAVIVDPAVVYGTVWNPPDELLPALDAGRYTWQVDALSRAGVVLARSDRETFQLAG